MADSIKPMSGVPVRFFIFDEEYEFENDVGGIRECNEEEFLSRAGTGTINYERNTIFANGVSQICLTIM